MLLFLGKYHIFLFVNINLYYKLIIHTVVQMCFFSVLLSSYLSFIFVYQFPFSSFLHPFFFLSVLRCCLLSVLNIWMASFTRDPVALRAHSRSIQVSAL